MYAVPQSIQLEEVKKEIVKIKGVKSVHHIHIWAMSTTKNAMTAHLILEKDLEEKQIIGIKHAVKHAMEHLNVQHVTLETEQEFCQEAFCTSE